ncbi:glycerate dehydrogenase [Komagataeibacter europaeus]|uniref:Glycerate dehydrogenase n=1 Tax=Komagataeibacter europaeus TaxID=33995 RepID=A0A0M0EDJ1_KOMEU|nr:NAD(P)-dependent oxidoreductase [Komagataeibacter europaeus]KON63342.1 glycerate dehydrogenase [Komagataeibacter europaeus]
MVVIARPPVVINQIGSFLTPSLAEFGARIEVVAGERECTAPWDVGHADILLTAPASAWRNAPLHPTQAWQRHGPRWVQLASAGVDGFPQWLLRGRTVTCGRGDAAIPIAEYVLAAILLRAKRLDAIAPDGPDGWLQAKALPPLGSLAGQTLGLAGYGAIGRAVAARARAFGMRVLAWRRGPWDHADTDVQPVISPEALIAQSDHLVLALPLTAQTAFCVNAALLARARTGIHLINVARGGLVDQDALLAALDRGQVGFATLDVTTPEPLPRGHPFYSHPAIRLTPHLSWTGPAVGRNLARRIAENLNRFLGDRPLLDVVDADRGY